MQKSLFHDLKNLGEYLNLDYEASKKNMSQKRVQRSLKIPKRNVLIEE